MVSTRWWGELDEPGAERTYINYIRQEVEGINDPRKVERRSGSDGVVYVFLPSINSSTIYMYLRASKRFTPQQSRRVKSFFFLDRARLLQFDHSVFGSHWRW